MGWVWELGRVCHVNGVVCDGEFDPAPLLRFERAVTGAPSSARGGGRKKKHRKRQVSPDHMAGALGCPAGGIFPRR